MLLSTWWFTSGSSLRPPSPPAPGNDLGPKDYIQHQSGNINNLVCPRAAPWTVRPPCKQSAGRYLCAPLNRPPPSYWSERETLLTTPHPSRSRCICRPPILSSDKLCALLESSSWRWTTKTSALWQGLWLILSITLLDACFCFNFPLTKFNNNNL